MMTVSRFSRQNDAGFRALNVALWMRKSRTRHRSRPGIQNSLYLTCLELDFSTMTT